ncbi:MAG: transporter [Ilumatobacteraceae bacterium]|nr:transporter [Ilumatobacteraceae bacterium]
MGVPAQTNPAEAVADGDTADARTSTVVDVKGLTMHYGDIEVLHGIDLAIARGDVCAIVGPNGAGKTTLVEILEGYRTRTGGAVTVLGLDPSHPTRAWRSRIGIVLQSCEMPAALTVWELVERFAGYYPQPRPVAETLELVGLSDRPNARAGTLSGGQQRRLDVAMALVGDPDVLFLDEPTTGFDPSARHQAWDVITGLRELGKTIVLTTHYMEEAEALADRVIVVVAGRVVADGTPETLGGRDHAPSTIRFRLPEGVNVAQLPSSHNGGFVADRDHVTMTNADLDDLEALIAWCRENTRPLPGLTVERPSLEDVYLELTGGVR